jgi:hypothetical protein
LSGSLTFDCKWSYFASTGIDASSVGTLGVGLVLDTVAPLSAGQTTTRDSAFGFVRPPFDQPFSGNLTIAAVVPEPSTWAMIILADLGFMAHRRKSKLTLMTA